MPLQKKGFPMFPCDLKPTVNGVCKHVRKLPIIVMRIKDDVYSGTSTNHNDRIYNPQIEMFARFKMKSSFHKTKRII